MILLFFSYKHAEVCTQGKSNDVGLGVIGDTAPLPQQIPTLMCSSHVECVHFTGL